MNQPTKKNEQRIWRWQVGRAPQEIADNLACEQPLEIRVGGKAISVTMRTPGYDVELAAGFLLSEAIIRDAEDIDCIEACTRQSNENIVNVFPAPHVSVDWEKLSRHVFASSSCGLCGKTSIQAVHNHFEPIQSDVKINAATILAMPGQMHAAQNNFRKTGGIHAAALFDLQGKLLVLREDVGRHNAVDKVLGYALLHDMLPLDEHVLLVSGRASFEIMQKALAGRIPLVAAISAPSDLAVQFAIDSKQTLVGFLRDKRMNIYSNRHRITFD